MAVSYFWNRSSTILKHNYLSRVETSAGSRYKINSLFQPVTNISLVVWWWTECNFVWINQFLILQREPRNHQRNLPITILCEISSTKQRINSSSSHPWKTCSREYCNMIPHRDCMWVKDIMWNSQSFQPLWGRFMMIS